MSFINLIGARTRVGFSIICAAIASIAMMSFPAASLAAGSQVVVTPNNTQGWSATEQDSGATFNYVFDNTAPGNPSLGALELATTSDTASHIQYMVNTNTRLSSVNELSYYTKQNSASFAGGDPSYQLAMCAGGITGTTCSGFTTMVFEPYENGAVIPMAWQSWNVMSGQMWSSHNVNSGTCQLVASQGTDLYSMATLQTLCPNAVIFQTGVNVGSNNPGYNVETDLFDFNGTVYNFEPGDANSCKNGAWMNMVNPSGQVFKNQGDCVSFFASGGRSN